MQLNSCDNSIHHYNVEILNIFDPELKLINTKPMIKKKIKGNVKWVEKVQSSGNISLRLYKKKWLLVIMKNCEKIMLLQIGLSWM